MLALHSCFNRESARLPSTRDTLLLTFNVPLPELAEARQQVHNAGPQVAAEVVAGEDVLQDLQAAGLAVRVRP